MDLCLNYVYLDGQKICKDGGGANSNISDPRGSDGHDNTTSNSKETTILRLGNESCDAKCQDWVDGLSIAGGLYDAAALLVNGGYAAVTDVAFFIAPETYPAFLVAYQPYSILANALSSVAMVAWITKDFLTGANFIDVKQNGDRITISAGISQDSIGALVSNAIGWNMHEPTAAALIDIFVLDYDLGRAVDIIPAYNPSFTIAVNSPREKR